MSGSNIMAVTVGTGANETLVVGAGVPAGSYMMFGAGGANWYIGKLGQAAGVSYTFGATAMTKWSVLDSWDMTEGGLYLGHNNSITNELRGKLAAAMTALTGAGKTPKIVSWLHVLGTNDGSDATTASAFSAALSAAYTRIASDFDLSGAQFVLPRCVGTSQDTAIRAGQASLKAANAARVKLLDMDSYTRWDGIHWNFAGLDGAGAAAFDVSFGLAAGL